MAQATQPPLLLLGMRRYRMIKPSKQNDMKQTHIIAIIQVPQCGTDYPVSTVVNI